MIPSWRVAAVVVAGLVIVGTRTTGLEVLLLARAFVFAILALSAWFLLRASGRASLGNAAFFGVSAYVVGLCAVEWQVDNIWLAAGAGVALAAAFGLVVGLVSGRLSGFHFLLITLAFSELLRALALRWNFVGGEDGIAGITRPSAWPLPIELSDSTTMMWFTGACLLAVASALAVLLRSPFGSAVLAVRDSERRMASLGYAPVRYRVAAVVVSSAAAGLAGALHAYVVRFVSPADLLPLVSAKALLFAAIGGISMVGSVVVSVVMTFLEDDLSSRWDRWPTVLGFVYIGIALVGTTPVRDLYAFVRARARVRTVRPHASAAEPAKMPVEAA